MTRGRATYLITHYDYSDTSVIAWYATLEEAQRHIAENPPEKYRVVSILKLVEGGGVEEISEHHYEPEHYLGRVVTRRMEHVQVGPYAHRVPIDCFYECPTRVLTKDWPWRILKIEGPSGKHPSYEGPGWAETCRCFGVMTIEGSPRALDAMLKSAWWKHAKDQ